MKNVNENSHCPLDILLRLLSGKWTPHILFILGERGPTRFGELRRLLDEALSAKSLSATLQRMCDRGLTVRTDESGASLHVVYALTEAGQAVHAALLSLQDVAATLDAAHREAEDRDAPRIDSPGDLR